MGINWLMELLSYQVGGSPYIWLIPDACNTLQGVFIFMIYFPKINKAILKKFGLDQSQQNSISSKNCSVSSNSSKNNDEITMPMITAVKSVNYDSTDTRTSMLPNE